MTADPIRTTRRPWWLAFVLIAAWGLGAPSAVDAATRDDVMRLVVDEALANGTVPPSLALAVARVESNFQAGAESHKGARGVMQIMPATARGEFGIGAEALWDARTNVRLGIAFLERLYRQYGNRWDLALSHYNGGTLKGRGAAAVPHGYTRGYVDSVLTWARRFERRRTVAQLRGATPLHQAKATTDTPAEAAAYWMFDDPAVEKGWRHYVAVAAETLSQAGARQPGNDPGMASGDEAEEPGAYRPVRGTLAADEFRPAHAFHRRLDDLRQSFRRRLQNGTFPWRDAAGEAVRG